MKSTKWFILLVGFIIFGCHQTANNSAETKLHSKLMTLAGTWKETNTGNYIEKWETSEGDTLLTGAGFEVKSGVLSRTETLAIIKSDGSIFYRATVDGQNQGATISFRLVDVDGSNLVFENPGHDFPQQIVYNFMSDSTISIKVGSIADTAKYFILAMKK